MHQVALVAVTTEIALGVSMPTIGADELELLELPRLLLELLTPTPPDEELDTSAPPEPLQPLNAASAKAKVQRDSFIRTSEWLGVMRHLH